MPQMIDAAPEGRQQVSVPMQMRAAVTQPASYREEDNTMEVVWSTGARRTMFDWMDWEYVDEELSLEAGAVNLDRLNAGAPLLDTHDAYALRAVIGSVVPGSVRLEDGRGLARIALADTDDVKNTVAKIRGGHIRNLSVGYIVHEYIRTEEPGKRALLRAVSWEPTEISFVPVPADAGAQVRSKDAAQGGFPCIIRGMPATSNKENIMPAPTQGAPAGDPVRTETVAAPAVSAPAAAAVSSDIRAAAPVLTARRIQDVVARSDLGADFALDLIGRNEEAALSEADLTDAIAKRLESRRNIAPVNANHVGARGIDAPAYRDAVTNAIALRAGVDAKLTDEQVEAAREFRGMTLIELARNHLQHEGTSTRGMDRLELAGTALGLSRSGQHTTSDFAQILSNAANKQLRRGFESAPQTFRPFISTGTLPDFKPAALVGVGDAPPLLLVLENGEFKHGTMSDFGDTYKLATYGRIIAVTRQTIINDDLRVFNRIPASFGRQAADLESDLVYAQLLANPVMYDGTVLFHVDHGNLAGSGGAINEGTLAAGELAMRTQKSPEGSVLNLAPRYLIVGPAKKVEAQKMLTAVTPNATSGVNVFQNAMDLIVESRITGNQWFLAADPVAFDTIELASLEGQQGVYTETRVGFDVDGVEMKARVDRVAKAIDWRGLYHNAGN